MEDADVWEVDEVAEGNGIKGIFRIFPFSKTFLSTPKKGIFLHYLTIPIFMCVKIRIF